jgi:hypothetical protein
MMRCIVCPDFKHFQKGLKFCCRLPIVVEIWDALQQGAKMGIGPITILFPQPIARPIEPDIAPMQRVENSPRTGDETYSSTGGQSAAGSDDDATEEELIESDESAEQPAAAPDGPASAQPISFFA